jgi:hypothetical protein
MNAGVALGNLSLASAAITRAGARAFLVDGTLLGAVREGAFIAHDRDVDVGVFIEEWSTKLPTEMQRSGFQMRRVFGNPDLGLEIAFRRQGLKLDVFFYYLDAETGQRFHAAWPKGQPPIRYEYDAFDLTTLVFMGQKLLAPADPEAFLAAKYGPEWRTPVVEWDWRWGPKNARPWAVPV